MKVMWYDYAKKETFCEVITQEQLEWLENAEHIEVDAVYENRRRF